MRFGILGPVRVCGADGDCPSMQPRQRAVLAYLLLHAGRPVSADRLVAAIWGDAPPVTARAQVQVAISTLRGVLRRAGLADLLETLPAGYALTPGPDDFDLDAFTARVSPADADAGALRAALGLWRGPALGDVAAPYADAVRTRLEDLRLTTRERLADRELDRGRYRELVVELTELVAAYPSRERFREQLMLALHGCGRTRDALRVADDFRRLLAEEHGLDPRPGFAALEESIRRADPALAPGAATRPAPAAARPAPAPAQLPPDVLDFTGRADQLELLDGLLPDHGRPGATAVVLTTIAGVGGVGKTALAVHWAHRVRHRFPDGQLYLNLHGYSSSTGPLRPLEALTRLLRALGVPGARIPTELDAAAGAYRDLVASRRIVVVLDNANSPEQVRPLLPVGPGNLALVTSRDRLAGLVARDGARRITLTPLGPAEALELLTRIVGADRVAAEPVAAAELAVLCGRLPLALRITAAFLVDRPDTGLAAHAAALREGNRLLALTVVGDEQSSVRAAFDQSYAALAADEARLFRLLGVTPGADLTVDAAAALVGVAAHTAEYLLDRLAAAHLVEEHAPGRYTMHDLVREYAALRAAGEATADALGRLVDWYLVVLHAAGALIAPQRDRVTLSARHGPATLPFPPDAHDAMVFLDAERANLGPVVRLAVERGDDAAAYELAYRLRDFFVNRGHGPEAVEIFQQALEVAERLGDPADLASAHVDLATVYRQIGRAADARSHLREAIELHRSTGDTAGLAAANNLFAGLCVTEGRYAEAVGPLEAALGHFEETGDLFRVSVALINLGICAAEGDRSADAVGYFRRAIVLQRRTGDRRGEAMSRNCLGIAHQKRGEYAEAADAFADALTICRELGDLRGEGDVHNSLGDLHRVRGGYGPAVEHLRLSLAIKHRLGDLRRAKDDLALLGEVLLLLGRRTEAREHLEQARALDVDPAGPDTEARIAAGLAALTPVTDGPTIT
ncbi:XRE family transcriptional regulator [Longispora fulva]|uniref:DNA-binding SARP family transcriptional activator/Tfp pilus assembly protein PilF n=1 Tax=Longispora fulva TaxID=619741 RepID=A0A8J7GNE8_9ACTN|nr:BTAD domain-containing putative transcriptional regulator [Longispora fulva]MBG6141010.1 DNA-binding SARP family transcriptional activator/Tfp pilus assembly protein PilF [Longispora fulva]GIG60721.1 XRE family transcriptional regulator [Longispora fulva]